jgi:hypothetical protein
VVLGRLPAISSYPSPGCLVLMAPDFGPDKAHRFVQPEAEIERHIEALIAHLKTLDVAGRQAIIARILHETVK